MGNQYTVISNSTVGAVAVGKGNESLITAEDINVASTSRQIKEEHQDFHLIKSVESFKGRDDELEKLSTWLSQGTKKMAVICGLPGYGKTELARRFAHLCKEREQVRSVLWLDAETPGALEDSFRELLRCMGARDKAELKVQSVVEYVKRHFIAEPHLFILDNALNRRNVLGFEPEGECRCIFTSHLGDWGDNVSSFTLDSLSLDAAVNVLRAELQHRFQEKDLEEYKHLAEVLSCVPLALQITAAYVKQEVDDLKENFCLRDYVDRLQGPNTEVIDQPLPDSSANQYDKTIRQAIQISLNKIKNARDYESRGLSTAACLLELGARAHVRCAWNDTPARVARSWGHALLARFLDAAAALQVQGIERDWADLAAAVEENATRTWWQRLCQACCCRRHRYHNVPV